MIPKLRFPGFSEEWEVKKLGDISVFHDGKRVPLSVSQRLKRQGKYPYYGASGVIDHIDDYLFDGEYILLGEDGANILTRSTRLAFIIRGKNWVNNHAHVIEAKGSNYFLAEYLERLNYEDYNTGTAQPKLNAAVCKKIQIYTPSEDEQEKIAGFLTVVDERIAAMDKKVELLSQYKKGVMRKIFSQKLRFKDENGNDYPDWQTKKLGELLTKNKKRNKNREVSYVQSVSNKFGFVSQEDYFEGANIASKDTSNYFVINKGTFAYNPSRIDVGSLAYKSDDNNSIVSPLYVTFTAKDALDDKFLLEWFSGDNFTKQMNRSFEGSVRNTLSYEALIRMEMVTPVIEEQQKIAGFLTSLDDKINLEKTKLEQTKLFKKSLLQRMFV